MENIESKNRTLVPGREEELERLMVENEAGLLRYATRIVNDDNIAQDVVQEAFIKLYRGWKNGSYPGRKLEELALSGHPQCGSRSSSP